MNLFSRIAAVEDDAWIQLKTVDVFKRYFWLLHQQSKDKIHAPANGFKVLSTETRAAEIID